MHAQTQPNRKCCKTKALTSWRIERVASFILSNSSMQQIPPSHSTKAPLSSTNCLVSGSVTTYAVNPTADEPLPDVYMPRASGKWAKVGISATSYIFILWTWTWTWTWYWNKPYMRGWRRTEESEIYLYQDRRRARCWSPLWEHVVRMICTLEILQISSKR